MTDFSALFQQYPQLNEPHVSRRALLAASSILALNLVGCGSSDDAAATAAATGTSNAGVVTTLAGLTNGGTGSADGTGTAASFNFPMGVAVDSSGNVYVGDNSNHMIRKITSAGVVTTLAGLTNGGSGSADGTGTAASFHSPYGVAVDTSGNVYVVDSLNQMIRKIDSAGVVTTLAGSGSSSYADGTGTAASFNNPLGVAVDTSGNVYVADNANSMIRKIA